ncbi:MAG TPA: hypothetical protein VFX33_10415 [Actinomycetales bacterium]|jgi:hypothetical protein|nr:hypothetical protein [Actinomycetales bacterium]
MDRSELIKLLRTSIGEDAGCEGVFALLDQYVEAELAGRDAQALWPAIAEHLRQCDPCAQDHAALLALVRDGLDE